MEIKEIKPTDKEYPIIMCLVNKPEQYTLFSLDGLTVVPLYQVIDALLTIKPDVNVVNGIKYCPNCGARMEETPNG